MRNLIKSFVLFVLPRSVFKFMGACALLFTFLPGIAAAATCELTAIRAAMQPNGKTRIVIETSTKPSYKLSYLTEPNRLVIDLSGTDGSARASVGSDSLAKSVTVSENGKNLQIIVNLKKSIGEIPRENIMILQPNGDTDYRLVIDFVAGSNVVKQTPVKNNPEPAVAVKNQRKPIIVIDAGHGGKDPGCIGKAGVKEKNVVLAVTKKLGEKLRLDGYKVYFTRTTDEFLNLNTRAGIAEKRRADLFISIHANANPSRSVKGFSIYTLSKKASDEEAQKLADAENAVDKIDVDNFGDFEPNVRIALGALQQHAVAESSVEFANDALQSMKRADIDIQAGPGLRSAPFAVLKSTIPSALVELGHLSNPSEEKLLNSSSYQEKLVRAIAKAVGDYDFEM